MMTDELLNALKLIKAECEKHDKSLTVGNSKRFNKCDNCPLSTSEGECGVTLLEPSVWSLQKREVYF